jgi:hypothetical protein
MSTPPGWTIQHAQGRYIVQDPKGWTIIAEGSTNAEAEAIATQLHAQRVNAMTAMLDRALAESAKPDTPIPTLSNCDASEALIVEALVNHECIHVECVGPDTWYVWVDKDGADLECYVTSTPIGARRIQQQPRSGTYEPR